MRIFLLTVLRSLLYMKAETKYMVELLQKYNRTSKQARVDLGRQPLRFRVGKLEEHLPIILSDAH